MPGILDQLFGTQQQPQNASGLVQSILSQRFQPTQNDLDQSAFLTGVGRYTSPEQAMAQRMAAPMNVAEVMGKLNMSQAALQHMQDEHDMNTLMMMKTFGNMPAGLPGMPNGAPRGMPTPNVETGGMTTSPTNSAGPSAPPLNVQQPSSSGPSPMIPFSPSQVQDTVNKRFPMLTGFGMPIEAPAGPVMARDANGNPTSMVLPGTQEAAAAKSAGESQGKNVAEAQKNVAGIDTRFQNAINILNDQIKLAPKTYSGTLGKLQQAGERNLANMNIGTGPNPEQTLFEQNNANLFTQELPAIMAGLGQSRIDIPLVNAIKEASAIYQYGAPNEKVAAAQNLKGLLLKAQENIHKNAAALGAANTPIPKYTDTNPPNQQNLRSGWTAEEWNALTPEEQASLGGAK